MVTWILHVLRLLGSIISYYQGEAGIKNCTNPFLGIKFDNHGHKKSKYPVIISNHDFQLLFFGVKKIKCLPITIGFFHVNLMVLWSFRNTRNQQFFESEFFQIPEPNGSSIPKIFKMVPRSGGSLILNFFQRPRTNGYYKNQIPGPNGLLQGAKEGTQFWKFFCLSI